MRLVVVAIVKTPLEFFSTLGPDTELKETFLMLYLCIIAIVIALLTPENGYATIQIVFLFLI